MWREKYVTRVIIRHHCQGAIGSLDEDKNVHDDWQLHVNAMALIFCHTKGKRESTVKCIYTQQHKKCENLLLLN